MDKAIVTLSFDDGRKDTYSVFHEILAPANIPATVNIPAGYIEKHFDDYHDIGYNGLMTKKELDWIAENPLFEIAVHGYMHNNRDDDVKKGVEKLKEWYPDMFKNGKKIGFASPHSEINLKTYSRKVDYYNSIDISYVRSGRDFSKANYFKRTLSFLARMTRTKYIFLQCYRSSLNNYPSRFITAVPVLRETTVEQIRTIVEYGIRKKLWLVREFHGIDEINSKEYQEIYCYDINKFKAVLSLLQKQEGLGGLIIKNAVDVIT